MEILVLDDAGSDDSWAKVERYRAATSPAAAPAAAPSQPRPVGGPQQPAGARRAARYVWFLDSDDVLLPGAITGLRDVIDAGRPDLVLCDFAYLRERPSLKHRLRGERHVRSFAGSTVGACRGSWCADQRACWKPANCTRGRRSPARGVAARAVSGRPLLRGHRGDRAAGHRSRAASPTCAAPWVGYRQHGASILASLTPQRIRDGLTSIMELQRGLSTPAACLRPQRAAGGGVLRAAQFRLDAAAR